MTLFLPEAIGAIVFSLLAAVALHELGWRLNQRDRRRHAGRRGGWLL